MWEEATVSVWPRPGKFTAGEYDHHLAKFAELIVRECMRVVGNPTCPNYAYQAIQKHFGVGE
jgi:hypothetical protein